MATDELLLDYVTGRLPMTDAHAIEAQARQDRDLAARITIMRGIVGGRDSDPNRPAASEFGWARLSHAIDRQEGNTVAERQTRPSHIRRQILQMAAAAIVAVVGWQAAVVPSLRSRAIDTEAMYTTASETTAAPFSAKVAFRPDATERDISAVLSNARASIAKGPSALGLYEVRFSNQPQMQRGLVVLRREARVIESVESNTANVSEQD